LALLLFLTALALLIAGGELLVRDAARLAAGLGVAPLVIGLTVVAFGTSSPELAVGIQAGLAGQADIAVGNVIGSNIFNVLFVLGLSALVVPLAVSVQVVRVDVPIMIGSALLLLVMALDGRISRVEAGFLVVALLAYITLQLLLARGPNGAAARPRPAGSALQNLLLMGLGLVLLLLGSRWLVESAVALATLLGFSQLVIGLTVVAAGTSMPEVVTSVVAGLRGQRDIAVGNVIGSNIFNILAVVGFAGLATPGGFAVSAGAIAFDLPVMLAVSVLCLPILFTHFTISRWEGLLFLSYYVGYTTYLILDAARHDAFIQYQTLLAVLLPLTVLTLIGSNARAWHARRR
jgi:cation:H+ antiporter